MLKKLIFIIFLAFTLSSCASVQEKLEDSLKELNEKIKGDGTPYIPGI
tara:strand:- start:102 stop:245 length:144 start_codon:yes stop_codon:yes gene_type:complete